MRKYSYGKGSPFIRRFKKKILGVFIICIGLLILLYFFFPLISYHLYLSSAFAKSDITSPLPQRFVLSSNTTISGLLASGITNVTSDFRDARNWFPQKANGERFTAKVSEYSLSIPSQGIENAKVSADDFDLSKHLVQYFTTSKNPTENGTSVIFGHSTLPQWFNPVDYTTIFAKLHTIKSGEEFIVKVNDKEFAYKVFSVSITDSKDPSIFSQSFDNSYITLITCTPPGTTWKRLVVRASLQS